MNVSLASGRSDKTGAALIAAVDALLPEISARSAEIEQSGTIPADLLGKMRAADLFRMYVPKSHGGLEIDFPTSLEAIVKISAADGSAGWTMLISASSALMVARAPRDCFDAIYGSNPQALFAGVAAPKGRAEKVDGGYRVTGRWGFSSGCLHADWFLGTCIVTENGKPLMDQRMGAPLQLSAVTPRGIWTIEDTWHVVGLEGTGSHHTVLNDVFVPENHTFNFAGSPVSVPGPLYEYAHVWTPLQHAAVALGLAERARAELIKAGQMTAPSSFTGRSISDRQLFLHGLGLVDAQVSAMRATLMDYTERQWRIAQAGKPRGLDAMVESIQIGAWLTQSASDVVRRCFELAGPQAVYSATPLQRCLRDIQVANQHAVVAQPNLITAGKLRLGLPAVPMGD